MTYSSCDISIGPLSRKFYYRGGTCDEAVIQQILIQQDYSLHRLARFPDIVAYAEARMNQGLRPLVVDAGANIGASAVYFSMKFPAASIVAIEPETDNYGLLCQNTAGLNVEAIRGGVASSPGVMAVVDVGEGSWGMRTGPAGSHDSGVPAVTMDEIYHQHRHACFPLVAKIDIEGGEKDLFSRNVEWVARTPLIIIELHDWLMPRERTSQNFLKCISQLDRDFVHLGENVFSIANNL